MKGTRAISFLLVLALMASLVVPGFFAQPAKADGTDNGMRISKTATKNDDDGSYTITLEAYATGSKVISQVSKDVPTDIVLVLDQSGSMDNDMHTYGFREYTNKSNSDYYNLRHNDNGNRGNLYYKLDDGGYASVSVVRSEYSSEDSYKECSGWTNTEYYNYQGTLYSKDGDVYHEVTVDVTLGYPFSYTYTFHDNITITSEWRGAVPDFKGKGPLYYRNTVDDYSYAYSYTDKDGVLHEIGTSAGNDATPGFTLYERYSTGTITRLEALKSAVTTFANSVKAKAMGKDGVLGTGDDVKHRVAVVGFASERGYGNNTELLSIAGSNSGSVGVAYNSITDQNLKDVLQDMTTTGGQQMVQSAIGALAAEGATEADLGMDMADRILKANPVPNGEKRNRVVVFFTDGSPTSSNGFETGVANDAISKAGTIKTGGASVYSVGIFDGADATISGTKPSGDLRQGSASIPAASNWFMQSVSSNNGTPRSPSYYLSASDAGTLSNIFQQIASNIESGGTDATLKEDAVIKDIVAPQFTLPEGADSNSITLESYNYIGENAWEKNTNAMGATAEVDGDQVRVTGFNFSENWVGTVDNKGTTEYRGSKLVISFKVFPKSGFLGGNGVETNAEAGVYENGNSTTPVMTFEKPKVDVPIANVTVDPEAKNVYLLQDVSVDTLKSGAVVKVGDVSLNLGAENYGLEPWQNAYVNIDVAITDKDGNAILATGLTGLTEDNSYTVSVTVSPKNTGTVTGKSGNGTGNIYVYKPVLTYKDSDVYYGATAPTDFSGNLASTSWQHDGAAADATTMGAAPALSFQYTPGTGVVNGTIATKQDIPVDVTVSIDGTDVTTHTTFPHQDCVANENLNGGKFLLHVKTCQLTINKTGGAAGEPYVFTVLKDGVEYTEASITGNGSVTIYELPVGTYSIQEDADWSWRYTPGYSNDVALSKDFTSGTITCTNTSNENKWLNGFSTVVQNIFGVRH